MPFPRHATREIVTCYKLRRPDHAEHSVAHLGPAVDHLQMNDGPAPARQ